MTAELVKLLSDRFIQRRDVKAWQFPGGGYTPERTPITKGDIKGHLAGKRSMGHYLVDPDDRCRVFCFDIDLAKRMQFDDETEIHPREELANPHSVHREFLIGDLTRTAEQLARRAHKLFDIPVAIQWSGNKGVHVYGFTGEARAADARVALREVLDSLGCFVPLRGENFFRHESETTSIEIEIYPKQDSLDGKDLGNLLRLPLGINKKSRKRAFFLSVGPSPRGEFHELDAVEALSGRLPWE